MLEDCHRHKLEGMSGDIHHVEEYCVMVLMELMGHVVELHSFHLKVLMVMVLASGCSCLRRVMGFHDEREVCHHSYLLNRVAEESHMNLHLEPLESACKYTSCQVLNIEVSQERGTTTTVYLSAILCMHVVG